MVQNGHRENTGKYGDASPEIRGRFPYFPDSRHTEHGGILPRHTGPATENGGPSRLTIAVRKKRKTKELTRRRGDAEKAKKEETTARESEKRRRMLWLKSKAFLLFFLRASASPRDLPLFLWPFF